ncbi:MAG: hypothetical protein JXL84_01675 [Deltaproteobacteria bacterium]|nr:hypothetical protein [Deltaproteobacteria bacterium]
MPRNSHLLRRQDGSNSSGRAEGSHLGQCVVVLTTHAMTSDQLKRLCMTSLPGHRKPAPYSLLKADIPCEILD